METAALERRDCFVQSAINISRALIKTDNDESIDLDLQRIFLQIAANLRLIYHAFESIPVYWIQSEVKTLYQALLENFDYINSWAKRWCSNHHSNGDQMLQQASQDGYLQKDVIIAFFKESKNQPTIDAIDGYCSQILQLVDNDNGDDACPLPAHFKPSPKNYFINFSQDLFNALALYTKCDPKDLDSDNLRDNHQSQAWHPTRICLVEEQQSAPSISLLISPMQMTHWQDYLKREAITAGDTKPLATVCGLVDKELNARVEIRLNSSDGQFQHLNSVFPIVNAGPGHGESLAGVLCKHQMTHRDKGILAYIIAQAYYHFYNSDLMRIKWTSDAIGFMLSTTDKDELLLQPYLIFPFGTQDPPEAEYLGDMTLIHHHPRILAFGILLLEIGLSKPFQYVPKSNYIAQANHNLQSADVCLKNLKKTTWDGFVYKGLFDNAIEYCIREGRCLIDKQKQPGPVGTEADTSTMTLAQEESGIADRREKSYKNVVLPLRYLAETGFGYKVGNVRRIRRKPSADPLSTDVPSELSHPEASFHAGKPVAPEQWLDDLSRIGKDIETQRRLCGMKPVIRERNFVDKSDDTVTDTYGHGTLMTRLIMKCAPSANIIIARVAENSKDLKHSQENIKEAILWAGLECQADIISMSFGFPKDHDGIDDAISRVQFERKKSVLFLASAGNSSSEGENFPARHSFVTSIYATNCHGKFMSMNPRVPKEGPAKWGTYGNNIPNAHMEDILKKFPKIRRTGSSVATAVAAGISATMIAYADLLPHVEGFAEDDDRIHRLGLLRQHNGMEALFGAMANKNISDRKWFIDPISFWRDTSDTGSRKHFTRYCKIHSCLQDVSYRQADSS
ncbi:hypothetical protein J3F84DRAFT_405367 [Trichoderma pleuroticola]